MAEIRRLVLDVLKPHHPSIIEMADRISVAKGVMGVICTVWDMDQETQKIKITIEGNTIDYQSVTDAIQQVGAVVHSIDSVSAGKMLVEEVETPQDR